MKTTVRQGVFETNSSSVHSLTMAMKDDYEKFENGELFYIVYNYPYFKNVDTDFISRDELYQIAKENGFIGKIHDTSELLDFFNGDVVSYDLFWDEDSERFDYFTDEFTTPKGETVVAFGYYGYDG